MQLLTWLQVSDIVIFETLKDGSLEINNLELNNCSSYRTVFQSGVNASSKMILKTSFFVKKLKISCSLDHTILFKFYYHVVRTFLKERMERL